MSEQPSTGQRPGDIVPRRHEIVRRWTSAVPSKLDRADSIAPDGADWNTHASLLHVRDMALDRQRGLVWVATWGGVYSWNVNDKSGTWYASEHGLGGNAMRTIAVDSHGIVWVGGQNGGLFFLTPGEHTSWQSHSDLQDWTIRCLIARPQGGVYVGIQHLDGRYGIGEIATPTGHMELLRERGLECRVIDALLVDDQDTLWSGNAWGLHGLHDAERTNPPFSDEQGIRLQVRALESAVGGGLWVGTNYGLYRYSPDQNDVPSRDKTWPRDEIISLSNDTERDVLWVATVRELGYIIGDVWQKVQESPRGQISVVLATGLPDSMHQNERDVWVGGSTGITTVNPETSQQSVMDVQDVVLSNAVQSIYADELFVWVGTARGLFRFDGQRWHSDEANRFDLRDVRAIVPGHNPEQVWVGSWRGGLCCLEQTVYIPGQELDGPIVALAAGRDGSLWAATLNEIFWCPPGKDTWQRSSEPLQNRLQTQVVQTMCHQQAHGTGGETVATLWVGTSAGLLRYRPELEVWDSMQEIATSESELEHLSIQALALDPLTNRLWVGTPAGLFSEPTWQCQYEGNVHALAFSTCPQPALWVGTSNGLQQWLIIDDQGQMGGTPTNHYTTTNAGLAANHVTALAVQPVGERQVLWVGTPAGISRLQW